MPGQARDDDLLLPHPHNPRDPFHIVCSRDRAVAGAAPSAVEFQHLRRASLQLADQHFARAVFTTTRSPRRIAVAGDTSRTSPSR